MWPRQRRFLRGQEIQALPDPVAGMEWCDAAGDDARDEGRGQLAGGGKLPVAARKFPLALLVVFASNLRAHVLAPVIELLLELVLDDLPLLLDDEDFLKPLGEVPYALAVQRPGHADLVERRPISAASASSMPSASSA
jgi:hypothetical protein